MNVTEPTMKELRERARELGVPAPVGITKKDLQAAVDAGPQAPAPRDELAELRARLAQLEASPAIARSDEKERQDAADAFAGWPVKGYTGPPPWEVARLHYQAPADGIPEPYTGPGAITHTHPMLTFGAAGEPVRELAALLFTLGYRSNSMCDGTNPNAILDNSVMHDVTSFCRQYGVSNSLQEFHGLTSPAEDVVDRVVGPYIWQALEIEAARVKAAKAA